MGCNQATESQNEEIKQVEKEEEKVYENSHDIAMRKRMIMNISELEHFVGKKHNDKVHSLLSENIDLLFVGKFNEYRKNKPSKKAQIFANCKEILQIESDTIYYDYYVFFVVDFLFDFLFDSPEDCLDLLKCIKPLIEKTQNEQLIPRISAASIYGMEARLLIDPRRLEADEIPIFVKQQYFGYDLDAWHIDGVRIYLDLIKKGMNIDKNDKYCQYALAVHYAEIEVYNKALYFGNKCGFTDRPDFLEFTDKLKQKFNKEEKCDLLQKYNENKDKYNDEENYEFVEANTVLSKIATWYGLHGKYEEGLLCFDEIVKWGALRCEHQPYKEIYGYDLSARSSKLEYALKFGYDFEAMDASEKLMQIEFDKAYTFYYLPDYIRDDPMFWNELITLSKTRDYKDRKKTGVQWLTPKDHKYDKEAGDKCSTHSFLYPFLNVAQKTKVLTEWIQEEEYNIKWKYSFNDMLDIIDRETKELSEDNVDIIFKKKEDGDDEPLLWNTLLAVWYVVVGSRDSGGYILRQYKLQILSVIFEKIKVIFDYIGKHSAADDIDLVFDKMDELWQRNAMSNNNDAKGVEIYHKMMRLMVDKAVGSEEEQKVSHDDEKKQFEGKVKILQFLNRDNEDKNGIKGWLNDAKRSGINRDEVMQRLKSRYEAKLDALGSVLTDYYNNELFKNPNYDELIGDIKNPFEDEILRQDKKSVLQRCKWGPFENDSINEEKYKQDLKTKYGLIPVNDLSSNPINNSFKNAYVDFVLQIGAKLQDQFQKAMRELFEDTNGEFCEAPIKKFERCLQKIDYDYKSEKEPVGAHILDIVRCLVVYENIEDLSKAYAKLVSKYKVCRLKNNFIRNAKVFGNYRCLMVNVLFEHPMHENIKMITEVQLTVRKVYEVRLTMHKTYKLFRAILPEDDAMLF